MRILLSVLTIVAISIGFGSHAFAFPTPEEMEANYNTCMSNDSSWYQRFGQYVVAFDLNSAARICGKAEAPGQPRLASCKDSGSWIYAGYYCDEFSGPNPL